MPGVGAVTNRRYAVASLLRGVGVNPYLRTLPSSAPLVGISHAARPPSGDGVIVITLPPAGPPQSNESRYPIAVVGGGFHGLLTSPTTRIPGLVSIVDVAPTALRHVRGSLGSMRDREPVQALEQLDARIRANDALKLPTLVLIAAIVLALGLFRARAALFGIVGSVAASLAAGASGMTSELGLLAVMSGGTIVCGLVLARLCTDERRILAVIAAILVALTVLMVVRPDWVAVMPLGPTQNARFWGIGNQLETLLLAPVIAGAALAGRRYGLLGLTLFASFTFALVIDNRLGSDGGGAVVFAVALAYVGARVLRIGVRGFCSLFLLNATGGLVIVWLDLQSAGPDHLRSVFARGGHGLWLVLANRMPLAYVPALHQWPLLVPLAALFAFVAAVAVRSADRRARELVIGAARAVGASLLVNDSATYELAAGAAVIAALARFNAPPPSILLPAPVKPRLAAHPAPDDAR